MTRQLTDVLNASLRDFDWIIWPDRLVAALLSEPCVHTIVCPTCEGGGIAPFYSDNPCPDCTDGRVRVVITATKEPA